MSWQKTADRKIVITLTEDEWSDLLLALTFASVEALIRNRTSWPRVARLINEVNNGNPDWEPYEVRKL